MHVDNPTRLAAGYTLGMEPSGREFLVLMVKGTYDFPETDGDTCRLSEAQVPLILADEHFGEAGHSAVRFEADVAQRKRRCDVLLDACAHAPGGRPAERVTIGVNIGGWHKVFDAVGHRSWLDGVVQPRATRPQPFRRLPISYDVAFGGCDTLDDSEALPAAYLDNPVGRGWHLARNRSRLDGAALPNTEETGVPVSLPWGDYRPMSFGPVGRGWPQRLRHAGTYDDKWLAETFPFLPADFDIRYFQAAPEDQQIGFPAGGELVQLKNLTPSGRAAFRLPKIELPVVFARRRGGDVTGKAEVDTITIEPEARRLSLVWRANLTLERDIFEVSEAIVGPRSRAFWRARRLGKTYYPSLGSMVGGRGAP